MKQTKAPGKKNNKKRYGGEKGPKTNEQLKAELIREGEWSWVENRGGSLIWAKSPRDRARLEEAKSNHKAIMARYPKGRLNKTEPITYFKKCL